MTHREADCETFTYVRTSQVLECWLGFFPLQPPSLGQSVHCKPSDVCLQKLAPWSRPGMVAGGPCGEDRRTWCPFCLLTCAIFSGAPCTLASVPSQDAFDGRLFFFFLVTFALIFIRKPVCGLPLSITQLLLLEFKNVYRPRRPVCVSPLMNWAPN